jgi:hypothetical protein
MEAVENADHASNRQAGGHISKKLENVLKVTPGDYRRRAGEYATVKHHGDVELIGGVLESALPAQNTRQRDVSKHEADDPRPKGVFRRGVDRAQVDYLRARRNPTTPPTTAAAI